MQALVFIEPNRIDADPFTTSKIVAEVTGVNHRYIKKQIQQREKELLQFGLLVAHETESTGGRPEEIVRLNEQHATLLVTFLKNTPVVVEFKTELIRQFYAMKKQMQEWRFTRVKTKAARRSLTDAVRDNGGSQWTYKHLTDLAYKKITGQTAKQLRASRGASKADTAKDFLTPDELTALEKLDNLMAALLDTGMDYHGIKAMLLQVDALRVAS